jgi:lauroyl/myristoyl acyltransferase
MTGTARIVVTLTVFAMILALVVVSPYRWNEACGTMLGSPVAALRTCKTSIAIDQLPGDQPLPSFFHKLLS